jgi:hypothetical protein
MKTILELIKAMQENKLPEIKGDKILICHEWVSKQGLMDWLAHYEREA